MMSNIEVINSFEVLIEAIDNLYQIIEKEREIRISEYIASGRTVPNRIKFEEINLSEYKIKMLEVHKTLQAKIHNEQLGNYEQKAKSVSIGGICEMIKDDYIHSFWDAYYRYIGWGSDYTVYDWIWEDGFKNEGIELIRSQDGHRREFVQTLVLESGIPKRRNKELLDFFILYWRYFRDQEDIESLIHNIVDKNIDLSYIPSSHRKTLLNLCQDALVYSRAFSEVVKKLAKVFSYIENSEDIFAGDLEDYIDNIYKNCGVDPIEILRDKEQLKKLYTSILGLVNPIKLYKILKSYAPYSQLVLPTGGKITVDRYNHYMYGKHIIKNCEFFCVPNFSYSISKLLEMSNDKVFTDGNDIILKSESKIYAKVNGKERPELIRKFYYDFPDSGPTFIGNIFHIVSHPAISVDLCTDNGKVNESIEPIDGFFIWSNIQYLFSQRTKQFHLVSNIAEFRLKSKNHLNKNITFFVSTNEYPIFDLKLDDKGFGACSDCSAHLNYPKPMQLKFYAVQSDSMDHVVVNGKEVQYSINLSSVMLFSKSRFIKFFPMTKGQFSKFGESEFILFVDKSINEKSIELANLIYSESGECGNYKVFELQWIDRLKECNICVDEFYWAFTNCIELDLSVIKNPSTKINSIILGDKQGYSLSEFKVIIYPIPAENLQNELIWNFSVNKSSSVSYKFKSVDYSKYGDNAISLSGIEIINLLKPIYQESSGGNASIDILLNSGAMEVASTKIWIFPDLQSYLPNSFRDGQNVRVGIKLDYQSKLMNLDLKDVTGRSKATLNLKFLDGKWELRDNEYMAAINSDKPKSMVKVYLHPYIFGWRLINATNQTSEIIRNLLRRELHEFEIFGVFDEIASPSLFINNDESGLTFRREEKQLFIPLKQLVPKAKKMENDIIITYGKEKIKFLIKFDINIDHIDIKDHLIDDCITGVCTYKGPTGTGLLFSILIDKKGDEGVITHLIPCDGNEYNNFPLIFDLKEMKIPKSSLYLVKVTLLNDINNVISGHDYGETWTVNRESEVEKMDFDFLREIAISSYKERRYFDAEKFLTKAIKLSPASELKWGEEFMIDIKNQIINTQINSAIWQISQTMDKQYKIDLKN